MLWTRAHYLRAGALDPLGAALALNTGLLIVLLSLQHGVFFADRTVRRLDGAPKDASGFVPPVWMVDRAADRVTLFGRGADARARLVTVKIFLASSAELKQDRNEFEVFIGRKNKDWVAKGVFLDLVIWEDFLDAVSQTRLQDEYNKAIRECDLFVMLLWTKVGQYTEEEFETAFGQFKAANRPFIFTYFKEAEISVARANKKDLMSLWAFQKKLSALGHFYTVYKNIDELKYKFNQQLDKLASSGCIEFKPDKDAAAPPSVPINTTVTGGVIGVAGVQNASIGSMHVDGPNLDEKPKTPPGSNEAGN